MINLICKECSSPRDIGRRLCRPCNLKRLLTSAKDRPRYVFELTCVACKNTFPGWRKTQKLCIDCYNQMQSIKSESKATNKYVVAHGSTLENKQFRHEHRKIAELLLGRKLCTNEVIHHMDENPENNNVSNLMVLDRRIHVKLHKYLDLQRVILEKSGNENSENCWKTLIIPMTTAWLEMAGVKVIKLWEIGQSAAEPLKEKSHEEGSETMHGTSVTGKAVEDDIVQTTTT